MIGRPTEKQAAKVRGEAVARRVALHLEARLGARRWGALRSDACKTQRAALAAATAAFLRAMEGFDGSPDSVIAINQTSNGYLQAYRDTVVALDQT